MRTVIIIFRGFALWAVCLGIAKLFADAGTLSTTTAATAFAAIWFLPAASNVWVSVSQAGYSFKEKPPIFLLIFLLPAAAAILPRKS
jgi:apolipoprotein N-acyltransferase